MSFNTILKAKCLTTGLQYPFPLLGYSMSIVSDMIRSHAQMNEDADGQYFQIELVSLKHRENSMSNT